MDPDLVIRAQHGDTEAFARLASACGGRLRAEPIDADLVRVTFTLDAGWDTG